jgi:hypothetical protein
VNFTTNAGQIVGSATTTDGRVTVNWTSSAPRIASGAKAGRFVIMAYAVGEESFTDLNGNGLADAGEFTDTTEAFRDDDDDLVRDANEPFIDFDGDGAFDAPDGSYNGLLQGSAFATAPRTKHIFRNIELVMSTDAALILPSIAGPIAGPVNFNVVVTDLNGNTMAKGTTIAVTADNGTLSGTTSFTIPNTTNNGFVFSVILGADDAVSAGGAVTIKVTSPGGLITNLDIPITGGV